MTVPSVTPLPTAPSRSRPDTFATEADAFLGALDTFGTEVNALGDAVETSTAAAATSATNAAASAAAAATSETNAAASAAAAAADAASVDELGDIILGAKASDPTLDNDGNPLQEGAIYYNTTVDQLKVYSNGSWVTAAVDVNGALLQTNNLSDLSNAATARTNLGVAVGTDVLAYDANLQGFVDTFTLPTTDGTAGQVLATDGLGNVTLTDVGGGGGSFSTTSYEALTAGDPVYMRTDGKVAKTFGFSLSNSGFTVAEPTSGSSSGLVFEAGKNRYLAFTEGSTSNFVGVSAITVDDNGEVVAVSSVTDLPASTTSGLLGYEFDGTNTIVVYQEFSNGNLYAVVISGTGTTITLGTRVTLDTNTYGSIGRPTVVFTPDQSKFFVHYTESAGVYPTVVAASVSGTSITKGTPLRLVSTGHRILGFFYDPQDDCLYCLANTNNTSSTYNVSAIKVDISGLTLTTVGSHLTIIQDTNSSGGYGFLYSTTFGNPVYINGRYYAIMLEVQNSDFYNAYIVSVENSFNWFTANTLQVTKHLHIGYGYIGSQTTIGVMSEIQATLRYNKETKQIYVRKISYSVDVNFASVIQIDASQEGLRWVKEDKILIDSQNRDAASLEIGDNYKGLIVVKFGNTQSEIYELGLNSDRGFIGIADATVSADASVDVVTSGGVSSQFSSLNAGDSMYLNGSTVSATGNGAKIGTAISSTEVVVTKGQ